MVPRLELSKVIGSKISPATRGTGDAALGGGDSMVMRRRFETITVVHFTQNEFIAW
jgi:hypothetical protein